MRKELLALFSGFPDHHFSEEITKRLREELKQRKSIVFITACPNDYAQNDDDCDGMHEIITIRRIHGGMNRHFACLRTAWFMQWKT